MNSKILVFLCFSVLYFLVAWLIWVGQELSGTVERDGAFIATLLVVPVYFLLSYFGKIFIGSVVESLALDKQYEHRRKSLDEDTVKKIVEGGAAAAVAAEGQQQKNTEDW